MNYENYKLSKYARHDRTHQPAFMSSKAFLVCQVSPTMPVSHRPGSLRQKNKKHKTHGHQGKRSASSALGAGRVESTRAGPNGPSGKSSEASKTNRVNHAMQVRKQKREQVWLQKRLGSDEGPPKLCVWVPLSGAADPKLIEDGVLEKCSHSTNPSSVVRMVTAAFGKFKRRLTFVTPGRDLLSLLEFMKVADVVLLVLPVNHGPDSAIDEEGDMTVTTLKAAGLPAVVGVSQGLELLHGKRKAEMRTWGQRFFDTQFSGQARVVDSSNMDLFVRTLCTVPARLVHWRSIRSYVIADSVEIVPSDDQDGSERGTLHIRGYVRGRPLNVNQVVHLSGMGHFNMKQIVSSRDPCPMKNSMRLSGVGDTHSSISGEIPKDVLVAADPGEQDDLNMEAEVDELAGEQTWPTDAELSEAGRRELCSGDGDTMNMDESNQVVSRPKEAGSALQKGTSSYQAEWLTEINQDEDTDQSDREESLVFGSEDGNSDDSGDLMDPGTHVVKQRKAEEDAQFPDEVETPVDRPARDRFARYRALKSFRTSPWDPKESLPADYARIFQFEDFHALHKDVMDTGRAEERQHHQHIVNCKGDLGEGRSRQSSVTPIACTGKADGMAQEKSSIYEEASDGLKVPSCESGSNGNLVGSGLYVEVVIDSVPLDQLEARHSKDWPLIMFALLKHEHRLSVLDFNVHRDPRFTEPVQSKDELVFHCGFRRWTTRAIFSQESLNCDKHKYERFLRSDRFTTASTYGPTTYQPCPLLVFKEIEGPEGVPKKSILVATGTLLRVDPDRIVLKKIVLTGYPIRVRKRKAVVKHMFHHPTDVTWFKPAELVTKYGLTGHIKEPVGTHGLMKVVFNKAVKQNDTVCLNLYKRVYPKMVEGNVVVR